MANYRAIAAAAAARYHLPVSLLDAQINQESGFNPRARSSAGAEGIAQFMPSTARSMGVNPWDPTSAINGMARMDAANYAKYHNFKDVLSIYNSGKGWGIGQGIGQTRNYVNSILAASKLPGGGAHSALATGGGSMSGLAPAGALGSSPNFKDVAAAYLMHAAANGGQLDPGSMLGLIAARQQLGAAQQTFGPQSQPGVPVGMPTLTGHGPSIVGDIQGEKTSFISKLRAAAGAAGATKIRVTSGYRSPAHNKAVGGVPDSNHTTGDAMDGYAFIPGHGWVPLGVALKSTASRYGLRSGDQPGFYHGGLDTVHVDDGFNQR